MQTTIIQELRQHYDLQGTLTCLASYADRNYLLLTPEGRRYVVKASRQASIPAEAAVMVALSQQAQWLPFAIPEHCAARDGRHVVTVAIDDATWYVRVISYLPGMVWAAGSTPTPARLYATGRGLAQLDRCLQDLPWPGHAHPWDLAAYATFPEHAHFARLPLAWQQQTRSSVQVVMTHASHLPRQLIHNDVNDHNLFLPSTYAQQCSGLIDFGDLCHSFRINELAIAAVYLTADCADLEHALYCLVQGYAQMLALNDDEYDCLLHLMLLRIIQSRLNFLAASQTATDDAYLSVSQQQLERQYVRLLALLRRGWRV